MAEYITHNESETEALGARLAETLPGGSVVAMYGDLGAGKTAFVRGMARGMGLRCRVTSPTFTIVNEYLGDRDLIHFDMYRITSAEDLETTGFYDHMDEEAVLAVEWSENIDEELPEDCIRLTINRLSEDERELILETADGDDRFEDISY